MLSFVCKSLWKRTELFPCAFDHRSVWFFWNNVHTNPDFLSCLTFDNFCLKKVTQNRWADWWVGWSWMRIVSDYKSRLVMVEWCARCDVIKTNLIRLRMVWNVERVSSCWAIDLRSSQCRCIVWDRAESADSRSWSNVHGSRLQVAQLARWHPPLMRKQRITAGKKGPAKKKKFQRKTNVIVKDKNQ